MRPSFLRWRPRFAAALLLLAATACRDPFEVNAQFETEEALVTVHALNGTPVDVAAGILVGPAPQGVRPGPDFAFDLAFDIDAAGAALLYPVDVVARPGVVGGRTVGLQKDTLRTYDEIQRAPASGYAYQRPLAIAAGDVGVIQLNNHPSCIASFLSSTIWAKYRVEAIDPVARTLRMRIRVDPNCGFRGLETGMPSR